MRRVKIVLSEILLWMRSIVYLVYWIIAHSLKSDWKNHIKKEKQGRIIDIIVNGPSFSQQINLVKNDGNDKCMVNFAMNSSLFWELKPAYYCVSDPSFFYNTRRQKEIDCFIDAIKRVDWNMVFFVTYYEYKCRIKNTDLDKLEFIHFVPFHSTPLPFFFKFRRLAFWLFRNGQAMPPPTSVSVPVIMNMINTGFTTINLFGFDQDWIHNLYVNEKNQVCHRDTHYYNEKGVLNLWLKNDKETFRVYEILKTQVELFESYWFVREYVDSLGDVKIVNKCLCSLIDAFDKSK